jgi:hypothetical protein
VWVFVILLLIAALLFGSWVITKAITRAAGAWQPSVTIALDTNSAAQAPKTSAGSGEIADEDRTLEARVVEDR